MVSFVAAKYLSVTFGGLIIFNPFYRPLFFPIAPEMSENVGFSDVIKSYRKKTLAWHKFKKIACLKKPNKTAIEVQYNNEKYTAEK